MTARKIGRNELCPCGSSKKYKKCCIDKLKSKTHPHVTAIPPEIIHHAQKMMRLHTAEENVRQQQQGYGRPIISFTSHGYRLVAVGKSLHWGKNWLVFPDFLLDFMKKTFSVEWGASEKNKSEHPVFRWLAKFKKHNDHLQTSGKLKSSTMMGFIACWLHLSYALYLIAHNDVIPASLLTRLRKTTGFMAAYYEAIVGAALAVAGFELSCAETEITSEALPEFRVKSKTSGKRYEVEAKRKEKWKSATNDVSNEVFQNELRHYVRNQVYAASKKKLKNPIYWFELNIPTLFTKEAWKAVSFKAEEIIHEAAETMTVDGDPIQPAFVVITNHTFLANEDVEGEPSFAFLTTIKVNDYPFGRPIEIEDMLESYDKYRDVFWMMDAWKVARTVPVTFDGTPPELLSSDGIPQETIKIGDTIETHGPDGKKVLAQITEIASMKDKAMVILTANGHSWLTELPLSDNETLAAQRYTDAIFGKDNASRPLREDNPFDLYDFFLRAHANMTQKQVDRFFNDNPSVQHYRRLPLKEARIRIAREHTKWMWIKHEQKKMTSPPS